MECARKIHRTGGREGRVAADDRETAELSVTGEEPDLGLTASAWQTPPWSCPMELPMAPCASCLALA